MMMENFERIRFEFPLIVGGNTIASYPVSYSKPPDIDVFKEYQYQIGILPVELMKFFFLIRGLWNFVINKIEPLFFLQDRGFISFNAISEAQQKKYILLITDQFWEDVASTFPPPKEYFGIRESWAVVTWKGEPTCVLKPESELIKSLIIHEVSKVGAGV